jgi:hypothetical protein
MRSARSSSPPRPGSGDRGPRGLSHDGRLPREGASPRADRPGVFDLASGVRFLRRALFRRRHGESARRLVGQDEPRGASGKEGAGFRHGPDAQVSPCRAALRVGPA